MKLKRKWYDAIEARVSRRKYTSEKIGSQDVEILQKLINEINEESGLHIQFVEDGDKVFEGFKASYGMIQGARALIALAGREEVKELKSKLGYYGELIVLECTTLGLGTCWIGGTYNKVLCEEMLQLDENEELVCIISVGCVEENKSLKEKLISGFGKKNKRFDEVLVEVDADIPTWVECGIEAALRAPSALNKRPINYIYKQGQIKAFIAKYNYGYEEVDLGISLAHFQLGALEYKHHGNWQKLSDKYVYLEV